MWKRMGLSKTKRSFFRRMRRRNVSSTHPAGETTIVDTLLFLVACANYSAVGRKMEKRESALTSQSGFCGIPTKISSRDKGQGQSRKKILWFVFFKSAHPPCRLNKEVSFSRFFPPYLGKTQLTGYHCDRLDPCWSVLDREK